MSDLDDIYSANILDLAANIGRVGRLKAPDASAEAHSKLCGSKIVVDLNVTNGVVSDYAHEIKACLLGQAAAAVMARNIVGTSLNELRGIAATMKRMLKEGGPVPEGRWADLAALELVRDYRGRHASTLLVFDAVSRALDEVDAPAAA
ncbi:MAG: iron-sulfur cluster assembly scaffold protein [Pseudomonadota bacterium]